MPEGQYSGDRAKYVYTSDDGTKYKLNLDVTLASVTTSGENAAGTELSADTPDSGAVNKPTNFKPRVVHWQGTLNGAVKRKSIVCGSPTSGMYASKTAQLMTIDGVVGVITGRRGEQLTY